VAPLVVVRVRFCCFNRLEKIDRGRLEEWNRFRDLSHKQVRKLHTNVGMVFQQFNLFPHLSVLDNLTLAHLQSTGQI